MEFLYQKSLFTAATFLLYAIIACSFHFVSHCVGVWTLTLGRCFGVDRIETLQFYKDRIVTFKNRHLELSKSGGILENNRRMLRKITGRKQNCLASNCVEDIFVKCLRQKSHEISYNKSD